MPVLNVKKKFLVLDTSYTLEMIRDFKLHEPVLARDLDGYFEHVWSVHPFATIIRPKDIKETYGKAVKTIFSNRHTIIEGKVGRFNFLKRTPLLNFIISQICILAAMCRLIRNEKINLIRATDPTYIGLMGLILSRIHRIPLVIRMTGNFDIIYEITGKPTFPRLFKSRRIEKIFVRFVLKRADLVVCANESCRDFAIKSGTRNEYTAIFRYGNLVHPAHRVSPHERASADLILNELKLSSVPFVIYVARLEVIKRHDHVLKVIAELKKRGRDIKAVLVGDGSTKDSLLELARELSIDKNIIFTGNKDQEWIATILPKALAVLSPHSGRALCEVALGAVPIVAYDFEWQPELITTGETGELVEDGNIKAMVEALIKYIDKPDYARRMGENARVKALDMMDPAKLNAHEKNEYEKLLARFYN